MDNLSLRKMYEGPIFLRVIIISIACIILAYLAYFFDISNLNQQYQDNEQKIDNIRAQLVTLIHQQAVIKTEIANISQVQNIFNQWQRQIIPYTELSNLINELLKIGASNTLHFNSFDPGNEIKTASYDKVPVKIEAMGNYHQIAHFVSQVANMPFILVIDDFSISSEKAAGGGNASTPIENGLLTAKFNMEVYSLAEKNLSK